MKRIDQWLILGAIGVSVLAGYLPIYIQPGLFSGTFLIYAIASLIALVIVHRKIIASSIDHQTRLALLPEKVKKITRLDGINLQDAAYEEAVWRNRDIVRDLINYVAYIGIIAGLVLLAIGLLPYVNMILDGVVDDWTEFLLEVSAILISNGLMIATGWSLYNYLRNNLKSVSGTDLAFVKGRRTNHFIAPDIFGSESINRISGVNNVFLFSYHFIMEKHPEVNKKIIDIPIEEALKEERFETKDRQYFGMESVVYQTMFKSGYELLLLFIGDNIVHFVQENALELFMDCAKDESLKHNYSEIIFEESHGIEEPTVTKDDYAKTLRHEIEKLQEEDMENGILPFFEIYNLKIGGFTQSIGQEEATTRAGSILSFSKKLKDESGLDEETIAHLVKSEYGNEERIVLTGDKSDKANLLLDRKKK